MFKKINKLSRNKRKALLVAFDCIALPLSVWAGFALRLGELWPEDIEHGWWLFVAAPVVAVPIFIQMGLYRAILQYVGSKALITIIKAITITTLILLAMVVMSDAGLGESKP